jgi:hypothetical protein
MDLDARRARPDLLECNVRYVLFHMIEETARHAGHADIIPRDPRRLSRNVRPGRPGATIVIEHLSDQ